MYVILFDARNTCARNFAAYLAKGQNFVRLRAIFRVSKGTDFVSGQKFVCQGKKLV